MNTLLGLKKEQSQKFLEDGTRIPVTKVNVLGGNSVVYVKTKDKDGYWAVQLGFGIRKHPKKPLLGHIKGASLKEAPNFLREVRIPSDYQLLPKPGDVIKTADVFSLGDIVNVTGVSKGKGFAGVVKRHHFKGGPRTHGQSDRERAPGSIGQTTTPGRVYRGKRMAGRMGSGKATVRNLEIIDIYDDSLLIKGLVPGGVNRLLVIKKISENKKFVPLYKEEMEVGRLSSHASDNARLPASEEVTKNEESKEGAEIPQDKQEGKEEVEDAK